MITDNLLPAAGVALYRSDFFSQEEADNYMEQLHQEIAWEEAEIKMFGKMVKIPRLQAWYGTKTYSYSGLKMIPHPWTPLLLDIKERAEHLAQVNYNSVLLNLYRDGSDSMGWHSDDEKELGYNPNISSISLGGERHFHLRHKGKAHPTIKVLLEHGSLLLMKDEIQHHWQHQITKTKRSVAPRINLTFRTIL